MEPQNGANHDVSLDNKREAQNLVVILDDDADYVLEQKQLIRSLGYRVRSFRDVESFLSAVSWLGDAGCVIMDLKIGTADSIGVLTTITQQLPFASPVIATKSQEARSAVRAMKSGAVDYIQKPISQPELVEVLRLADERSKRLMRIHAHVSSARQRLKKLTKRQLEIVRYIAHGFTSKEIGAKLNISYRTVETHRSWIMDRLEVGSLADLVHLYFKACPEDIAAEIV